MQDANNLNAVREWKIKNEVISYGLAAQTAFEFVSARTKMRKISQRQESILNSIKKLVGVIWMVLRDVPPYFVKIAFGFGPNQDAGASELRRPFSVSSTVSGHAP